MVLAVVLAGSAVAATFGGEGGRAPSGAAATFTDATHDNGSSPDLESVTISNDQAGMVTFAVKLVDQPALDDLVIELDLDTDRNQATGDSNFIGDDYVVLFLGPTSSIVICKAAVDQCDFHVPQPANPVFTYAGGVATVTLDKAFLGDTDGFDFVSLAYRGVADAPIDAAPEFGVWSYELALGPPELSAGKATLAPRKPHAGGRLIARVAVEEKESGEALASGHVTCKATIGGRAVRAVAHTFAQGVAMCSWRVPAGTEGKVLRGTVTVTSEGASISRSFSAAVS